MRIQDIAIDANATLGAGLLLTEVIPVFAYAGGKRTETVTGYKYIVVLPERGFDKIGVKIMGSKQVESPVGESPLVEFDGLELFVYWMNGKYNLGARAAAIRLV